VGGTTDVDGAVDGDDVGKAVGEEVGAAGCAEQAATRAKAPRRVTTRMSNILIHLCPIPTLATAAADHRQIMSPQQTRRRGREFPPDRVFLLARGALPKRGASACDVHV
jgi:hypothetical protein